MRKPLALWSGFVLAFTTLSYTLRFTSGKPPKDLLYRWSTVVGNLVQFAIIAAIVYGIAGAAGERRRVLALRRPTSWRTAVKIGLGVGLGMYVLTILLGPVLHPDREQGVTPDIWEPRHIAAYIANGIVIAAVAPIVEELTFRGLGYYLLSRYGRWVAIMRWMPTARAICAMRQMLASTSRAATIMRSLSSSTTITMNGRRS